MVLGPAIRKKEPPLPLNGAQFKLQSEIAPYSLTFKRHTFSTESQLHINLDAFDGKLSELILARVTDGFLIHNKTVKPQSLLPHNVTNDRGYSFLSLATKGIPK